MTQFRPLDLLGAVVLACGGGRRQRRTRRVRRHVAALVHDPIGAATEQRWMDTAWWQA